MSEKRGRIRADFDTEVIVLSDGKEICFPNSENISLNGLLLHCQEKIPVGQKVELKIKLSSTMEKLYLEIQACVVRHTEKGIALTFEKMDVESFEHLKKIVMYNSKNPDEFLEQCQQRPGFK